MSEMVPRDDVPDDEAALLAYLIGIIDKGRRLAAVQVNATLTLTYWLVGRAIVVNALRNDRAEYGQQIVATLSQQFKGGYGRGFDRTNVTRMVAFLAHCQAVASPAKTITRFGVAPGAIASRTSATAVTHASGFTSS